MQLAPHAVTEPTRPQLIVTRIVGAPLDLVFEAWTRPEHLAHWWGPKGSTLPSWVLDFRVGGSFRFCMRSSDGKEAWVRGFYREIAAPERIVFSWAWEEPGGMLGPQTLVMVRFSPYGDHTKVILRHACFETDDARDEHQSDWEESLARLVEYGRTLRVWPTMASLSEPEVR